MTTKEEKQMLERSERIIHLLNQNKEKDIIITKLRNRLAVVKATADEGFI